MASPFSKPLRSWSASGKSRTGKSGHYRSRSATRDSLHLRGSCSRLSRQINLLQRVFKSVEPQAVDFFREPPADFRRPFFHLNGALDSDFDFKVRPADGAHAIYNAPVLLRVFFHLSNPR